jgi:hypothetical protein
LLSSACGTVENAMREPGAQSYTSIESGYATATNNPRYAENKIEKRNGMTERNDGNI